MRDPAQELTAEVLDRPWVVVGDVHLHEDQHPSVAEDLARLVRRTTARDGDAVLVFNGDTFDLDRIRHEPRCGVGTELAAARLERVLASCSSWVTAVRSHVEGGGRAIFIAGNHDAELLVEGVRVALVRSLGPVDVVERLQVVDRLVEHGHQHDPDSAFYPDMVTALSKRRLSAFPLASLLTRMLLSRIPRFELSGDNHRAPVAVLGRVLRDYKLAAAGMIARFPFASLRILWHSVLARVRGDVPDDPRVSMSSPLRVARRLYLDRYFFVVLGLGLATALLLGVVPSWVRWPLGMVAVALVIPPRRSKQFAHRDVRACRESAKRHAELGVRLIVHGHVHRAFADGLGGGAVHANHGAFSTVGQTGGRTYLRVSRDGRCEVSMLEVGSGAQTADPGITMS